MFIAEQNQPVYQPVLESAYNITIPKRKSYVSNLGNIILLFLMFVLLFVFLLFCLSLFYKNHIVMDWNIILSKEIKDISIRAASISSQKIHAGKGECFISITDHPIYINYGERLKKSYPIIESMVAKAIENFKTISSFSYLPIKEGIHYKIESVPDEIVHQIMPKIREIFKQNRLSEDCVYHGSELLKKSLRKKLSQEIEEYRSNANMSLVQKNTDNNRNPRNLTIIFPISLETIHESIEYKPTNFNDNITIDGTQSI